MTAQPLTLPPPESPADGLSQKELDALSNLCGHEDKPSSPVGSVLVSIKKARAFGKTKDKDTEAHRREGKDFCSLQEPLAEQETARNGLTQDALDKLSIVESDAAVEAGDDLYAQGDSDGELRALRRRRAYQTPFVPAREAQDSTDDVEVTGADEELLRGKRARAFAKHSKGQADAKVDHGEPDALTAALTSVATPFRHRGLRGRRDVTRATD